MGDKINVNKRRTVYHKYGGRCAYCGCYIDYRDMQIDHIIPVQRGMSKKESIMYGVLKGTSCYNNLNPSCGSCNSSKNSFKLEVWREELEKKIFRIRRDSSSFRILERFGMVDIKKEKVEFYFENYGRG